MKKIHIRRNLQRPYVERTSSYHASDSWQIRTLLYFQRNTSISTI